MTIPTDVLKLLDVKVGSTLQLEIVNGAITMRPTVSQKRSRLAELLRGVTPAMFARLNADTAWSRKGQAVGRELA